MRSISRSSSRGSRTDEESKLTPNPSIGQLFSQNTVEETIQEGKRFWGQIVRTFEAAAHGTVPEGQQAPSTSVAL